MSDGRIERAGNMSSPWWHWRACAACCGAGGVLALTLGCALVRSAALVHNHPSPLARTWVDATASTPSDTVEWVLTRGGEDESRHRRVDAMPAGGHDAQAVPAPAQHFGLWFVQGELSDTLGRQLCFIPRPGRSRSFCQRFDLDSTVEGASVVRRLVLRADAAAAHRVAGHVLLSRGP